jgi:hypothetical protein
MSPLKRLAMIAGLAVAVFGGLFFLISRPPPDPGPTIAVLDGDPRMKVCVDGASGVPFATPELLGELGAAARLARDAGNSAQYRVTVLRPTGEPSVSVRFWTPQNQPARADVRVFAAGSAASREFEVDFQPASRLVQSFEDARIWGSPINIPVPIRQVTGPGTAVVEIEAGTISRCITTRYDDERILPLLRAFNAELTGYVRDLPLDALVPPAQSFLRQP